MLDYPAILKARLIAHPPLTSLLTGGIYDFKQLPAEGIKQSTMPSAYLNNKKMKPLCVVHGRAPIPFSRIKTQRTQFRPIRQVVEIYLYDDRDAGFTTLRTASGLINSLLDQTRLPEAWKVEIVSGPMEYRDDQINYAAALRLEYEVFGHLGD